MRALTARLGRVRPASDVVVGALAGCSVGSIVAGVFVVSHAAGMIVAGVFGLVISIGYLRGGQ